MEIIKSKVSMLDDNFIKEAKISNEADVIVRDTYPDVQSIVDYSTSIEEQNIRFDGNRYVISGKLICDILYIADDEEKTIYAVNNVTTFEEGIDIKGLNINNIKIEDKEIELDLYSDYVNITLLNSRKFNIKYVIEAKINICKNKEYDLVEDISEDEMSNICKKYKKTKMYNLCEKVKQKILFKERYQLPSNKPEIYEIIKVKIGVSDIDFVDNDYEIIMNANMTLGLLYRSIDEEIVCATINIPIKEEIENVENFTRDIDYKLAILEKNIRIATDNENERRVLDIEAMLELSMNIYMEFDKNILEDVYAIDRDIKVEYEDATRINQICKNSNNYNLREIVKLEIKDVMQIVDTNAKINVENVEILKGVTKIYGEISGQILCIVANDNLPLQSINYKIPFTQIVESKGTEETKENDKMGYTLNTNIDNVITNMLNPEELEIRLNINFDLKIFNKVIEKIISKIEINEEKNENVNSDIRVYVTKDDEPLWNILKKYKVKTSNIKIPNRDEISQDMIIKKNEKILIM